IWCPLWAFIDRKTINEKIAQGDEVWSYTALVQRSPRNHPGGEYVRNLDPPYWHIDNFLSAYRVPFWINWQYNITGYLYWSSITYYKNAWSNPESGSSSRYNGGGFLFYPGTPCGIDGPIACMRVKNVRDGFEDYEYLTILKKLAGKEAADRIVNTISPSWWEFSKEPADFIEAREKLAEEILKAME
ncbi:unnamed protein product, partial [marine sediment metagenome]